MRKHRHFYKKIFDSNNPRNPAPWCDVIAEEEKPPLFDWWVTKYLCDCGAGHIILGNFDGEDNKGLPQTFYDGTTVRNRKRKGKKE